MVCSSCVVWENNFVLDHGLFGFSDRVLGPEI